MTASKRNRKIAVLTIAVLLVVIFVLSALLLITQTTSTVPEAPAAPDQAVAPAVITPAVPPVANDGPLLPEPDVMRNAVPTVETRPGKPSVTYENRE